MRKFKTSKKFPLTFLGKDWKGTYIEFNRVTISDIQNVFPKFKDAGSEDEKDVLKGVQEVINFLESKFISGKGILDDGSTVDLAVEDLKELPSEVLSRALTFLSQGVTPKSPKQLETSSTLKDQ